MSQEYRKTGQTSDATIRMLTRIIKSLLLDREEKEAYVTDTNLFVIDDEWHLMTEQTKNNSDVEHTRIFLEQKNARNALGSRQKIVLIDAQGDPNVALLVELRDPSLMN